MRVVLLTGDNSKTALSTAKQVSHPYDLEILWVGNCCLHSHLSSLQVGIAEVFAEVLPNQKQSKIQQLQVGPLSCVEEEFSLI